MRRSSYILGVVILFLLVITASIWYAVFLESRSGKLSVSFLNIGQGDSILIQTSNGHQILIDGGPDREVLRQLPSVMPWYDRSIDVVVATHPDADHISGLIDVLARFKIDYVIQSSVQGDTDTWYALEKAIASEGSTNLIAKRGQVITFGDGAYLEILFPDRDVSHLETNMGSVVARLVYGDTSFMLTGDSPQEIEKYLVSLDGSALHSTVLKAGHHGSKTSSSELFLGFVDPEYGVFSRGCENKYGHPSEEAVERFKEFEIPTFDTCKEGTVTFVSDGTQVMRN